MHQKLLSSTLLYSFLAFLQPALSFLLQPIYLQYFDSSSEYGLFVLMNNYANLVTLISALGVSATFFTFYYDYHQEEKKLKQFLGQILSFTLYGTVFFTLFSLLIGNYIFYLFNDEQVQFFPHGFLATISGTAFTLVSPFIMFLRNKKNLRLYALLMLGQVVIYVAAQLYLIIGVQMGVTGALLGKAISVTSVAIGVLWLNRHDLTWRIEWHYFKKPFEFMRFYLPNSLLEWGYACGDRFILEQFFSLALVGIYGLLNTLVGAVELLYFAVRAAILPFLYEAYDKPIAEQKAIMQQLYRFYIALVLMGIAVVLFIVAHIEWLTAKIAYLVIKDFAYIYAIGYLLSSISFITFLQFYYHKDSKTVFYFTLVSTSVLVALNIILLPILEIWGVVIAFISSRGVVLLGLIVGFSSLLQPFRHPKVFAPIIGCLLILLGSHYFTQQAYISHQVMGLLQFIGITLLVLGWNIDIWTVYLKKVRYFRTNSEK